MDTMHIGKRVPDNLTYNHSTDRTYFANQTNADVLVFYPWQHDRPFTVLRTTLRSLSLLGTARFRHRNGAGFLPPFLIFLPVVRLQSSLCALVLHIFLIIWNFVLPKSCTFSFLGNFVFVAFGFLRVLLRRGLVELLLQRYGLIMLTLLQKLWVQTFWEKKFHLCEQSELFRSVQEADQLRAKSSNGLRLRERHPSVSKKNVLTSFKDLFGKCTQTAFALFSSSCRHFVANLKRKTALALQGQINRSNTTVFKAPAHRHPQSPRTEDPRGLGSTWMIRPTWRGWEETFCGEKNHDPRNWWKAIKNRAAILESPSSRGQATLRLDFLSFYRVATEPGIAHCILNR